jgi:hypothetical protein
VLDDGVGDRSRGVAEDARPPAVFLRAQRETLANLVATL